ncbi:unnamed protein product [Lampetra fluviatilis]
MTIVVRLPSSTATPSSPPAVTNIPRWGDGRVALGESAAAISERRDLLSELMKRGAARRGARSARPAQRSKRESRKHRAAEVARWVPEHRALLISSREGGGGSEARFPGMAGRRGGRAGAPREGPRGPGMASTCS